MIILEGNEQMMIRSAGITVLGLLFCFSSVVLAAEISPKQDDLVTRIRNAEQVKVEENRESIQERINKIMEAVQKPAAENSKKLPQVAVMYVNNAKTTYDDETDREVIEQLDLDTVPDPLETITKKETYQNIELKMSEVLSDFEQQVFNEYLNGESYTKIATKLNSHAKAVDNAIQRIKKKVEKHIAEEDRL